MSVPEDLAEILGTSEVLKALSVDGRRRLARTGSLLELSVGRQLFARGDPGDACYVVLTGALEVTAADAEGREVWLASLAPGALIGEMAVLDGLPRSATVSAVRRSRLVRMGRDSVIAALCAEPDAARALLVMLVRRLRSADALIEENALVSLAGRLARLLLKSGDTPITLPQGEIARMIGASRERVNRTLATWRIDGLIEMTSSGVRILDRAQLAAKIRVKHSP